jgi:hypothetical protein
MSSPQVAALRDFGYTIGIRPGGPLQSYLPALEEALGASSMSSEDFGLLLTWAHAQVNANFERPVLRPPRAPEAELRVTMPPPPAPPAPPSPSKKTKKTKARTTRRLDWASLHQHTFGVDVLRCPCGGRRIHAIHSTRKTAEERLLQLGQPTSTRV